MRRIRDHAHASWVDAITPVFAPGGDEDGKVLVDQLAVLGRAMTDGLSVTNSLDGATHSSHVAPFVSLIRGLAGQRGDEVEPLADRTGR